jgi:hypothetical protein
VHAIISGAIAGTEAQSRLPLSSVAGLPQNTICFPGATILLPLPFDDSTNAHNYSST